MTSLGSTSNFRQRQTEAMYIEWTIPSPSIAYYSSFENSPTFQFCDCPWYLRICPRGRDDWMCFYVTKGDSDDSKIISFILGLKKTDGTILEKSSTLQLFDKDNPSRGWYNFTKYNAEGIPSTNWNLTCRMISDGPMEPQPLLLKKYVTLSANLKELLLGKNNCDVTIKVKEQEFPAHKAILGTRSPVLAAAFQHDMCEKQTGVIIIEDCCPDSFKYFLDYLYTGTIEGYSWRNVYHLYTIADKYNEQDLKCFCLSYLMLNLAVDNICDVVRLAVQYEETELMSSAQFFFNQNVNKITATCDWEKLLEDDNRLAIKILKQAACNNENTINQLLEELNKK